MSRLVEVRLFRADQSGDEWARMPVHSYLPALLDGDALADNIKKRLAVGFFKQDQAILQIRWNIKGNPEDGVWVKREDL
jgi:hypothetical protein